LRNMPSNPEETAGPERSPTPGTGLVSPRPFPQANAFAHRFHPQQVSSIGRARLLPSRELDREGEATAVNTIVSYSL
jgi:hypothetical protein